MEALPGVAYSLVHMRHLTPLGTVYGFVAGLMALVASHALPTGW